MANVGYIRVSSIDQNTDRQLDGVELDKTFTDKVSGKSLDRPKLKTCLEYVREGDTLHVHSMDRLARNLGDLEQTVKDLTGRGISVKFHKEGLEFTGKDDSMSTLMLQIMGAVAQFERAQIKERQLEGIKAAQKKGVKFGRRSKLTQEHADKVVELWRRKRLNKKQIAEELKISRNTLYKLIDDYNIKLKIEHI